jgi:outer membrane protein
MRLSKMLLALCAVCGLAAVQAVPVQAQTPPPATPPAQTPATPAAQTPAAQTPAAKPAEAPRPFPEGAKIAYIDIQAVASNSVEGKAASGRIQELVKKKTAEIGEKNKALEAARAKQTSSGSLMNDQARLQLEKEIDRIQREVQFSQQEAQSEQQALQAELQVDFQRKLNPILEQIAKEKGLHMLVDIQNSGAVWVDVGLDLTQEVIKRLDANKPAPPVKK